MSFSEIGVGAITLLLGIVGFFMRQQVKHLETVETAIHQHAVDDATVQAGLLATVKSLSERVEFLQGAVVDVLQKAADHRPSR